MRWLFAVLVFASPAFASDSVFNDCGERIAVMAVVLLRNESLPRLVPDEAPVESFAILQDRVQTALELLRDDFDLQTARAFLAELAHVADGHSVRRVLDREVVVFTQEAGGPLGRFADGSAQRALWVAERLLQQKTRTAWSNLYLAWVGDFFSAPQRWAASPTALNSAWIDILAIQPHAPALAGHP